MAGHDISCRSPATNPPTSYTTPDDEGTTDTNQVTEYHEGHSLEEKVLNLVGETSDKFIPAPTRDQVITDALEGLRRFKETVRWKDYFRTQKLQRLQQEREKLGLPPLDSQEPLGDDDDTTTDDDTGGLQTHLKPVRLGSSAPRASDLVELFLKRVEDETLNQAFKYSRRHFESERSATLRAICDDLKSDRSIAVVPTDKTNSFRVIPINKYIDQMRGHLATNAKPIPRQRLTQVVEEATNLLESISYLLSRDERNYIKQSIKSRAIPTPKLLIKDHKQPKGGVFPTRC
jgi:hypothetical protein